MNQEKNFLDSLKGSVYIVFNMNDTFYFASADSCEMPTTDYLSIYPHYEKYGYDLIIAYEAIARDHDPTIAAHCTKQFFQAKEFLLKKLNNQFCPSLFRKKLELDEEKMIFNGQIVLYEYFDDKVVAYLESGEKAEGFNKYNAKENLLKKGY